MCQQTNENDIASCRYQELNPEMDAFLSEYLEDGRRKGLQESTIHLHDKIGHYFLSALTRIGCVKPQEMNPQNIGTVCLSVSSKWYLSHIRTFQFLRIRIRESFLYQCQDTAPMSVMKATV